MRASAFAKWMITYADGLERVAPQLAADARKVARIFDGRGTMTVAAVVKAAENVVVGQSGGQSAGRIHAALGAFQPFVKLSGKKTYVDDLKLLVDFLAPYRTVDVEPFVSTVCAQLEAKAPAKPRRAAAAKKAPAALRQDLVDAYVGELRAADNDGNRFREVYNRLNADKSVRGPEAAAIATAIAYKTTKSTSRKESMNRIWKVQGLYEQAGRRFGA